MGNCKHLVLQSIYICVNINCILRPYVTIIICSLSVRAEVLREYIHILLLYDVSLFSLFLKFIV